jgi:hypothetical protein
MLFYDISGSLQKDNAKLVQQKKVLANQVYDRMENKTVISLGYLFGNSASILNQKELFFEVDESESPTRQDRNKLSFAKKAVGSLFSDSSRVNRTLILSSLKHVNTVAKGQSKVSVFYVTDFLEDSEFRIIKENSFSSLEDADKKGRSDAQLIMKRYGLERNTNCEVEVIGLLPLSYTDDRSIYVFLNVYWEAVFTSLFEKFTIKYQVL